MGAGLAVFVLCGRDLEDSGPDERQGENVETKTKTQEERQGVKCTTQAN
jgi:hypothetical protein